MGISVVPVVMVVFMMKRNARGGVHHLSGSGQGVCHKVFQTGAAENNHIRICDGLHLVNLQGIVVQAGDRFGNQLGYGYISAVAKSARKFIDG